jgi:hypothetical protein
VVVGGCKVFFCQKVGSELIECLSKGYIFKRAWVGVRFFFKRLGHRLGLEFLSCQKVGLEFVHQGFGVAVGSLYRT